MAVAVFTTQLTGPAPPTFLRAGWEIVCITFAHLVAALCCWKCALKQAAMYLAKILVLVVQGEAEYWRKAQSMPQNDM